jgi:hypothetical protein
MIMIRSISAVSALATALTPLFMRGAFAHDGWAWIGDGTLQIEGTVTGIYIGNPLATLDVDVAGVSWRVDLAPLPATLGSGLVGGAVRAAVDVIAIGSLTAERVPNRMRARCIVVNGVRYEIGETGAAR